MLTVITPAPTFDLTTLDTAKAELGVTGSADDAAIYRLIRQASAACARACSRPHFGRELYEQTTESYDPCFADPYSIILARDLDPVIVSVARDGLTVDSAGWRLDPPLLRGVAPFYSYGALTIRYYAGFELLGTLPDDIERAALLTIRGWWASRGRDPAIRQEMTEGVGSVAYATAAAAGGILPEAAALLAPWRRIMAF